MKTQSMILTKTSPESQSGFTLVELLLVLMILGILAAIVVPQWAPIPDKARVTKARAQIAIFSTALDSFQIDVGYYPANQDGLEALRQQPSGAAGWNGPYLKTEIPPDPWEHPYVYEAPGTHNPTTYDIVSTGRDGQEGTQDDIASWSLSN